MTLKFSQLSARKWRMLLKWAIFNCCSQLGIRGIVVNVLACISFGTCTCWAMMYTWPWSKKGLPNVLVFPFKYAFSIRCLGEAWGWNVLSPLVWASWRGRNLYGSWQNQTPVALFPHHPSCTETLHIAGLLLEMEFACWTDCLYLRENSSFPMRRECPQHRPVCGFERNS